jgi:Pyridine nucleotide-disulphide oxidoreductase
MSPDLLNSGMGSAAGSSTGMSTGSNVQGLRQVVIIGGGFAGATLVRSLQHMLPDGWRVVLVSEESYTTFNPMLAEVVGASIFPEHVVAPLRELVAVARGHRFVMGRVSAVDSQAKTLTCHSLAGDVKLAYDHLVFAFGNRARLDFIPGMAEHALPLKTIGDALEIRNTVLRKLAQAELQADASKRSQLAHFVVIGGGFSGVEVAGELVDCLRSIQRYYPGVPKSDIRVTLVHDQQRLLPELPEALGLSAQRSLSQRGVQILLGELARGPTRWLRRWRYPLSAAELRCSPTCRLPCITGSGQLAIAPGYLTPAMARCPRPLRSLRYGRRINWPKTSSVRSCSARPKRLTTKRSEAWPLLVT